LMMLLLYFVDIIRISGAWERKRERLLKVSPVLYLRRESNPHTEVHEFESCASTNSATQASIFSVMDCKCNIKILLAKIFFEKIFFLSPINFINLHSVFTATTTNY